MMSRLPENPIKLPEKLEELKVQKDHESDDGGLEEDEDLVKEMEQK